MFSNKTVVGKNFIPLGAVVCILVSGAAAQSPAPSRAKAAGTPYHFQPTVFSQREARFYEGFWGVDSLRVKTAESGELIRFSYRVLDANKAMALNDKKSQPFLYDPRTKAKLAIPSLEKVGQLRQSSTPEAGKSYWMAFSNKGGLVTPGDRVTVVIGSFRAEGLIVQ